MLSIPSLLALANAGDYPEKREYFYKFKDRFLRRWAEKDGFDKQVIKKSCWRCKGTGDFVSRCQVCTYQGGCHNCWHYGEENDFDDREYQRSNRCPKCCGTGFFVNTTQWLERWKIGGRVFHVPVSVWSIPILTSDPVEIFEGYIKHAPVDNRKARIAAVVLIVLFDVPMALGLGWDVIAGSLVRFWNWVSCRWSEFRCGDELPF